jgi:hypothetical protein
MGKYGPRQLTTSEHGAKLYAASVDVAVPEYDLNIVTS